MRNIITVAAAQLADVPDQFTQGISAREINHLLIQGGEREKMEAAKLLHDIDIDDIRSYSVHRMIDLMKEAARRECDLIVFPELALTSFFPYLYIECEHTLLRFFERGDIRQGVARPLFDCARRLGIAFSFGYAECAAPSLPGRSYRRYNASILVDKQGHVYTYRKTHIPGFKQPRPGEETFQFEQSQFDASQAGYPVFRPALTRESDEAQQMRVGMIICHDRRYSAPFLVMGMQKVDLILIGYNTPLHLPFATALDESVYSFHYLPLQAQAISEGTFIVAAARAGKVFGVNQIAGSCIISPYGEILTKTEQVREELLTAVLDIDMCVAVRAQKYGGERLEPQVLLQELCRLLYAADSGLPDG